jgi:hypothetical protein
MFKPPYFVFRYPDGFPGDAQRSIESARSDVNRWFSGREITSCDRPSEAKSAWLLRLASATAPIFGRVASVLDWDANQRREALERFIEEAANAARVTRPALEILWKSTEWQSLDDVLFPPANSSIGPAQAPTVDAGLETIFQRLQAHFTNDQSTLVAETSPGGECATADYSGAGRSRPSPKELVAMAKAVAGIRSFEKFANRIGIGRDTLYAITTEKRRVSGRTYLLVAQVCGCKPEDLQPRGFHAPAR